MTIQQYANIYINKIMKSQNKLDIQKLIDVYNRFESAYKGTQTQNYINYKKKPFSQVSESSRYHNPAPNNSSRLMGYNHQNRRLSAPRYIKSASPNKRPRMSFSGSETVLELQVDNPMDLYLRELYKAKCKDIKVEYNQKQQNIFLRRMRQLITPNKIECIEIGFSLFSMNVLSTLIFHSKTLLQLILDKNHLGDQAMKVLTDVLPDSSLIYLSLISTNISSKAAKYLFEALQNTIHLTEINLSSAQGLYRNKIGAEGAKPLRKILRNVDTLHCLNLAGSNITEQGFSYLCCGLEKRECLYSLNISKNEINQNIFVGEGMKLAFTRMVQLDLSKNFIKDEGFILLGEILGRDYLRNTISNSLKQLNVKQNFITSKGLETFSKLMIRNFTLENLNLDNNYLSKGGRFQAFKAFIRTNRSIIKLSMRHINLESDDYDYLTEGVSDNLSLSEIDLSDNQLDSHSFRKICNMLKNNKALKIMRLNHCNINDEFMPYFVQMIGSNHQLEEIQLENNFIKDYGARQLEMIVPRHKQLTNVRLENNIMSIKKIQSIKKCLNNNKIEASFFEPNLASEQLKLRLGAKRKQQLIIDIHDLRKKIQTQKIHNLQDDIIYYDLIIQETLKKINRQKSSLKVMQLTQKHFLTQDL